MTSLTNFSFEDASTLSSSVASFFSSLPNGASNGAAMPDLFNSLLNDIHTLATEPKPSSVTTANADSASSQNSLSAATPSAAVPKAAQSSSPSQAQTNAQNSSSDADNVMKALRQFVQKWEAYKKSIAQAENTNDAAPKDPTTQATASAPTDAAQQAVASADGTGASTNAAPPTLADVLQQLQQLLQLVQQQKHDLASQNGVLTTGGATTSGAAANLAGLSDSGVDPSAALNPTAAANAALANTPNAEASGSATASAKDKTSTDPSIASASDLLAELFLLARFSGSKAVPASNASAGSAAAATTSATSSSAVSSVGDSALTAAQLKSDLASLQDALKALSATAQKSDQTGLNTLTTAATLADSLATLASSKSSIAAATASLSQTTPVSADGIASTPQAPVDFINQLNTLFGANVPRSSDPSFMPTNDATALAADVTQKAPSALDLGTNGGSTNGNTTANTDSQNVNNLLSLADTSKSSNPYNFASQLSAARAANGGTTGLPSAVEQAMLQISRNVKGGNDSMSLQLHPAELGTINIKLSIGNDGAVQGTVVASHQATLDMMQKDSRSLERALQDAGLRADPGSLQFSLGGQSQNQSGSAQNQNNARGTGSQGGSMDGTAIAVTEPDDASETWVLTPGRVNMKV